MNSSILFVPMDEKTRVENRISAFFPSRWTRKEISFFIDENPARLDIEALSANLNSPIRDFVLRGGKRLRPVLFLKTLTVFGLDTEKYLDVAVLLELVHNATLILDDIEDRATERRGKPTTHLVFGLDTAVNSGMALHILPLRILQKYDDATRLRLLEIYSHELSNLSFGQALDIYWHKQQKSHVTLQKYFEMVSLKTGSLFRMAIRFAVVIAGQDKNTEKDFLEFASAIGAAFQIVDDVLDLSNTDNTFGKSFGNDITEGKMSLPVLIALKIANTDDANRLKAILSRHTRNRALIVEATKIIKKSGGLEEARRRAEEMMLAETTRLTAKYKDIRDLTPLTDLALMFVKRDH